MEEGEKITFCLNCFRLFSKEAIQQKGDTLLIFCAFHYFYFLMTSPKPIIRILQGRGRGTEAFQGRGSQRLYGKKETSALSKFSMYLDGVNSLYFLRKRNKTRKKT